MNSGTPNKEILLLSPPSIKYSSHSKQQLLEDEGDPPHINNHLIMRSQMKYQTPIKREEGTLIKTEFQDSSRKKGVKDQLSSSKNPFNRFEDQQISPMEKEAFSLKKGGEIIVIQSPKLSSKKKKAPNSLKKIWESPQKEMKHFTLKENKIEIDEISFQEQYKLLLSEISENPRTKIALPFFFTQNIQVSAGKLLCFELNPKNGRIVKYNKRERTCLPSFRCFGCRREFEVASALGGHLSKCKEKELHFEVLQNHSGDCDFDLYFDESLEKKEKKEKKKKQKNKKKVVKKINRGKHAMIYKVIGRKSRLIIRGNYPRIAKQKACMKIRQALADGVQNILD